MTTMVLDPGVTVPYRHWLGDDVVVVEGRSARADWRAMTCREPLTDIVALDPADLVRAAVLREALGVPGMSRRQATVLWDLVLLRARLAAAGLPTVPAHPVTRAHDLFAYAEDGELPARLRLRRARGWRVLEEIGTRPDLVAATRHTVSSGQEIMPSLLVEPLIAGTRTTTTQPPDGALDAIAWPVGWPVTVDLILPGDGGVPVVDALGLPERLTEDDHRSWVQAQSGQIGAAV